jgi:hypothetical protein
MHMQGRTIAIVLLVAAAVLLAGCTQTTPPPESPSPTPRPTFIPPTTAPEPDASQEYLPGAIPSNFAVSVAVDRNTVAIRPNITVTFRGGKGANRVYSMEARVTRSDGIVLDETILRPLVNDFIELEGTTGTDRVQVFITLTTSDPSPGPYLVFDEEMRFR